MAEKTLADFASETRAGLEGDLDDAREVEAEARRALDKERERAVAAQNKDLARFFLGIHINTLIDQMGTDSTLAPAGREIRDIYDLGEYLTERDDPDSPTAVLVDLAIRAGFTDPKWAPGIGGDMTLGELRDGFDREYRPPEKPKNTTTVGAQSGEGGRTSFDAAIELDADVVARFENASEAHRVAEAVIGRFDDDPAAWMVGHDVVTEAQVPKDERAEVAAAVERVETGDSTVFGGPVQPEVAAAVERVETGDSTVVPVAATREEAPPGLGSEQQANAIQAALDAGHTPDEIDDFFAWLETQQADERTSPNEMVVTGGTGELPQEGDGTPDDGPWGTVEALQEALAAAGFNPGPIDGIVGPRTRAAMEAFNVSIGGTGMAISADGWATLLGTLSADTDDTTPDDTTPDGDGDPTEPPDEIVTDEDIANLAAAYGYGARWLNHEELGPILRQAAEEGWYDSATGLARLEAAIKVTDWWDDFDRNERNHQLLEASDPAEAERLLDLQVDMLQRAALRLGLTIADDRVREMARAAHVEGWSDYQINQNMLLEAEWAPGQAGGAVEDFYSVIDAHAGDYLVGHLIDDDTKDEWASALYLGDATEMGIRNEIAALAQSAFPSMDARIGQGYTARQILSPLRQEAARLLEIDAASIDFMSDPRFQPIWQQQNDDGTTRVMSVSEVGQYVRGLEDWQTTTNATDAAYRFADFIGTKFGKAA